MKDKNILEEYKNKSKLSYYEIAKMCDIPSKSLVYAHIKGEKKISAEAALKYHKGLGIPLDQIRPDIWNENILQEMQNKI